METEPLLCEEDGIATRLRCAGCGLPICPTCMTRTQVGLKCSSCSRPAGSLPSSGLRRPRLPWLLALGGVIVVVIAALVATRADGGGEHRGPQQVGSWEDLGFLDANQGTAAAVMAGGAVTVIGGGVGPHPSGTTTVLDPSSGQWSPTGRMLQPRRGHQAVVLADGRILVAGGIAEGRILDSVEMYDPATRVWTMTGAMATPRLGHSLTVLPGGAVLAAGGTSTADAIRPLASAELYDPSTGRWTPTAPMNAPRFEHTATLVVDGGGRVLMVGGLGVGAASGATLTRGGEISPSALSSTEMFDPAADRFLPSGDLAVARSNHAAALLADGSVLVVGGVGRPEADASVASVERFVPDRATWSPLPALHQARSGATATTLADGAVLVTGGDVVAGATQRSLATAEVLDPARSAWHPAGSMRCARSEQAAVLSFDRTVVVVGGDALLPGAAPQPQACAERYRP